MNLLYRPIKTWPEGWAEDVAVKASPWSPFRAPWSDTVDILDFELDKLGAVEATIQVDTPERNCRADGGLRRDAKIGYYGVIVSFDTDRFGTLTYPCNAFDAPRDPWRQNVRAIALGLRHLRTIERYGIANRGQQYAGWAELGTGIATPPPMTRDQAVSFLVEHGGMGALNNSVGPDEVEMAFKRAAKVLHPDAGGDPEMFRLLTEARAKLLA